jgi:hypothetical protein
MPFQTALAKLFRSSSCYPLQAQGKRKFDGKLHRRTIAPVTKETNPNKASLQYWRLNESLHFRFIGNVTGNASQVCYPKSFAMKLKYIAESATPPGIHIAVEARPRERGLFLDAISGPVPSSQFPALFSDLARNAFGDGGPGRWAQVEPGPAPGARFYPVRTTDSVHPQS